MGFYDDEKTANQYMTMAERYDDLRLVEALRTHLPEGASVLKLGMGPGVDSEMLKKHDQATGPDNSQFFLDRYRSSDPDADLLHLDAVELPTERMFDCIYCNTVLHHLTNDELITSLHRQKALLSGAGVVMHPFFGEGQVPRSTTV